jgi:hypothetical protein
MNMNRRSSAHQALGVLVDGREMRLARLGREGGQIKVLSLESVILPRRLDREELAVSPTMALHEAKGKDIFGFSASSALSFAGLEDGPGGEVAATLINVFSKYPLGEIKVAVNTPENQVAYHSVTQTAKLKGKKLQKQLHAELGLPAGATADTHALDHFQSPTGEMTAMALEGSIPLIKEINDVQTFLPGGAPFFALAQTNELALVNLARATLNLEAGKISALVYIGHDFSRVIILQGDHPLSFVPTIHEGYTSPQVCETIFSKILLEQEEAGLPEIENLYLAGEVGLTHAHDFFSKQFPEAKVQSFTPGPLNVSALKAEEIAIFPNYAIAIGLAWQALETKSARFISTDLLPQVIRESQRYFKVAWHGFALLGFVFLSVGFLSFQGLSRWYTIHELEESIRVKQASLQAMGSQLNYARQMQTQIANYQANLNFLDAIIVDPGKWSRLFEKLSTDFQSVNRIWVDKIKSDHDGFTMVGRSLIRDRIPSLADGLTGVDLKRVTRVVSGGGETAYEFEMTATQPALPTPSASALKGGTGTVMNASIQSTGNSTISNKEGK